MNEFRFVYMRVLGGNLFWVLSGIRMTVENVQILNVKL